MELHYLLFDFSDEDSGCGSFDAMASVEADRLPALLAEATEVLRWAHRSFGRPGALQEEAEWDYEVHAVAEPSGKTLRVGYDTERRELMLLSAGAERVTLTLTVSGTGGFCGGLREAFALHD